MKIKKIVIIIILMMFVITGCSKKEVIKDTITREKEIIIDYSSSLSFEKALNNKEKVENKIVKFLVKSSEKSDDNIIVTAGNSLKFKFDKSSQVKTNDYIVIKVKEQPELDNNIFEIEYELIQVISSNEKLENNEENKEEIISNQILMTNNSLSYAGKMINDIEKEFKDKGFKNIKIYEVETNNKDNKTGIITSVSIDGKSFEKDDLFTDDKEVIIYCWKYVEEEKNENDSIELSPEGIVLPKEGSKLAKDFDMKSENTIYYINIDGKTNKPTIKQWEKATVTDGFAEYLDCLKSLDYSIEITEVINKEPYSGFYTYESRYKVTKGNINWTMYHFIEDEKYVEYQLDIYLK